MADLNYFYLNDTKFLPSVPNFLPHNLHPFHSPEGFRILRKCSTQLTPQHRILKHKIMYWGQESPHLSPQTTQGAEEHCIFRVKCNVMTIALKWINLASLAQPHSIQRSNHCWVWCGSFLPNVISFYPLRKWQWGQKRCRRDTSGFPSASFLLC